MTYAERRAAAIALAAAYVGWDLPPQPTGPLIGRKLELDGKWVLIPISAEDNAYFKAREREQNRRHFPK